MIIQFQVIPSLHGDRVYTLDDQGILRVKQPQQTWRELANDETITVTSSFRAKREVVPLRSAEEIMAPQPSILDSYLL
jgi:hypothetical protein